MWMVTERIEKNAARSHGIMTLANTACVQAQDGAGTWSKDGTQPGGAGGSWGNDQRLSSPHWVGPTSHPTRLGCPAGPGMVPSEPQVQNLLPFLEPRCPARCFQGEHTFHGCVGVRAVGKHHIHILQLQPLQGSFQTCVGEEQGEGGGELQSSQTFLGSHP